MESIPPLKELSGSKFGKLTAIERVHYPDKKGVFWLCKCDCGNMKIVKSSLLIEGKTRSCGCLKDEPRHENLVGLKFNLLTVVECVGKYTDGHPKWLCECECGEKTYANGRDLKSGRHKSCGCYRSKYPKDLSNLKFGRLTVLRKSYKKIEKGTLWECMCNCGNKVVVTRDSLTTGNTISCGCAHGAGHFIDRSGEKFGRLLVDGYVGRTKGGKILWRCICDCGTVSYTTMNSLILGKTVSCGCYKNEQATERLREYAKNAVGEKSPNWNPNLTDEERRMNRAYKEYNDWRFEVYKRDSFRCFVCEKGEGNLNAHHIFSHNKYKNLRLCVPNGITLCEDCHTDFHKLYKKGNNDILQFTNFLKESFSININNQITEETDRCSCIINSSDIDNFNKNVNNDYTIIHTIISSIKDLTKIKEE